MSLPQLLTLPEFCAWARIGRTKAYEEIAAGQLSALKIGRRTLVRLDEAVRWLDAMPGARAQEGDA
jgi:hypothetical protein